MLQIDGRTIGDVVTEAARVHAREAFLCVPQQVGRAYHSDGLEFSFCDAMARAAGFAEALRVAGYGHGHRIAVLLENRPEMLLIKLACAMVGSSWVPLNPDYRVAELGYVLGDSGAALVIVAPSHAGLVDDAVAMVGLNCPVYIWDDEGLNRLFPEAQFMSPVSGAVGPQSEASLLYTSGTTGRPKGCIISHEYELMMGEWYGRRAGRMTLRPCGERLYNPLPLFHVNASIVGFYGMLLTGNCVIIPERFSATRWWDEIRQTKATAVHYLGIVIPVLMNAPVGPSDREHDVRWAFGAGVEPTLHGAFEARFGFPLVEGWGMTETCRILADSHEPRQVDTRAIGRPEPGLEIRVVGDDDVDVPIGEAGEMLVRHSAETPRRGAFSGYLNQPEATEEGWRGGWWHTGDVVKQDDTGLIYFVDRRKNIIRRSGENIAAAEVEAVLQARGDVAQVAVIAVEDSFRDEEVMACVVLAEGCQDGEEQADVLFGACNAVLAYYKAPGWIVFVPSLPVTGTQKVLKHLIFGESVDPRTLPDAHDLRHRKKRD